MDVGLGAVGVLWILGWVQFVWCGCGVGCSWCVVDLRLCSLCAADVGLGAVGVLWMWG